MLKYLSFDRQLVRLGPKLEQQARFKWVLMIKMEWKRPLQVLHRLLPQLPIILALQVTYSPSMLKLQQELMLLYHLQEMPKYQLLTVHWSYLSFWEQVYSYLPPEQ
jgi:hypothetical protein